MVCRAVAKMLKTGINGSFFKFIYNIYKHIKSCVFVNQSYSPFLMSDRGVCQGENLSPLLFLTFLKWFLKDFQMTQRCNGIPLDVVTDEIYSFDRIILLIIICRWYCSACKTMNLIYKINLNSFKHYCWWMKVDYKRITKIKSRDFRIQKW